MKFPKEINTYCPFCKSHQVHKVKVASRGRRRALSAGELSHKRKLTGHGGKRAGEKTVKKQGKRQKVMLQCPKCKKKHERVLRGRTTKKIELKA
ncbi:50S ribosomal protein L44e [Candidatus Micrarchaeota archaeon]|nr:50S ribosomal protein L44e [Candidatus Micrarchaeota archaeon]